MENKLVNRWRNLIFDAESQLKKHENILDISYEGKCVFETWEQFLNNQKSSLENYINFLNHKNKEKE